MTNTYGARHHHEQGIKEGSWMAMKKYLEQEMICTCLRGRISYQLDVYSRFGSTGNCVTISLDDTPFLKADFMYAHAQLLKNGMICEGQHVWDVPMSARDVYDDTEVMDALRMYRNQTIQDSLGSDNPIVRLFAIVDRRVGKRTLVKMRSQIEAQPAWLQTVYRARYSAEGIRF